MRTGDQSLRRSSFTQLPAASPPGVAGRSTGRCISGGLAHLHLSSLEERHIRPETSPLGLSSEVRAGLRLLTRSAAFGAISAHPDSADFASHFFLLASPHFSHSKVVSARPSSSTSLRAGRQRIFTDNINLSLTYYLLIRSSLLRVCQSGNKHTPGLFGFCGLG